MSFFGASSYNANLASRTPTNNWPGAGVCCVLPPKELVLLRCIAEQNLYSIAEEMRQQDPVHWKMRMDQALSDHSRDFNQDFGSDFTSGMQTVFQRIDNIDQAYLNPIKSESSTSSKKNPLESVQSQTVSIDNVTLTKQTLDSLPETSLAAQRGEIRPQGESNVLPPGPVADGALGSIGSASQFNFNYNSRSVPGSASSTQARAMVNQRETRKVN